MTASNSAKGLTSEKESKETILLACRKQVTEPSITRYTNVTFKSSSIPRLFVQTCSGK